MPLPFAFRFYSFQINFLQTSKSYFHFQIWVDNCAPTLLWFLHKRCSNSWLRFCISEQTFAIQNYARMYGSKKHDQNHVKNFHMLSKTYVKCTQSQCFVLFSDREAFQAKTHFLNWKVNVNRNDDDRSNYMEESLFPSFPKTLETYLSTFIISSPSEFSSLCFICAPVPLFP